MIKLFDRNFDYGLVFAAVTLMAIGVVMIHSASSGEHVEYSNFWARQLLWVILSIFFMFTVALIPHKFFYAFSYVFFTAGIIFLLMTQDAHAYLDPGTGSFMLQILIGVLFGGLFAIKLFWRKILIFIKNIFSKGS